MFSLRRDLLMTLKSGVWARTAVARRRMVAKSGHVKRVVGNKDIVSLVRG